MIFILLINIKMNDREMIKELIKRRFELDKNKIDYQELVKWEKERIEILIGDLIEKNRELEDLLPYPIQWR